jgi:hypothetical protein
VVESTGFPVHGQIESIMDIAELITTVLNIVVGILRAAWNSHIDAAEVL